MSSMRHAGGVLKNRIMNEEKERPRYHPPSAELRGKQKETPKESASADPTGQEFRLKFMKKHNKKIIIGIIAFALLGFIVGLISIQKETRTISLYYYNQELDQDETGNILCSRKGLASVEREIPITQTPIQDTIKLLLSNVANIEGVSLKGASLKEGVLTLEFDDPNNKTVGGACRVGILWFQIEATAKQFPEVQQVRFLPEELFQP